jgi:hypothetical protein
MITLYRRIRLLAYFVMAVGMVTTILAKSGGETMSQGLRWGVGTLIAAFVLLLVSQGLYVVIQLSKYRPTKPEAANKKNERLNHPRQSN